MASRCVKIIRELSQGIIKSPLSNLCPSARYDRTLTTAGIRFKNPKELKTSCDGSAKQMPCRPCPKKPRPCCRVTCRTKCVKLVRCCPPSAGCRPPCKPSAPACPVTCQSRHLLKRTTPQKPCPRRECHSICGVNQSGVNRKLDSEEAERRRQYEEEVHIRKCLDIVRKPKCSSEETFAKAMQYLQEKCNTEKNPTEECVEFQRLSKQWCQNNKSEGKVTNPETQENPNCPPACAPVSTDPSECSPTGPQSQNTPECPPNTSTKCCDSGAEPESQPKTNVCDSKSKRGPSGHIKWTMNSKLPDELGRCGPNRKKPEPLIVELIDNQDLHKCLVKTDDAIDPCEHKPKVMVTIDRSNDPKRLIPADNTETPKQSVEKIKKCELNTPKNKTCEAVKTGEYAKPCVEMDLQEKIKYRGADRGKCLSQKEGTVKNDEKNTKNEKKTIPDSSPKCKKPYSAIFSTKNDSNERKIHTSALDDSARKQFLMEHGFKSTGLNIINRFKYERLRILEGDRNNF